jgi:hypothetical protein
MAPREYAQTRFSGARTHGGVIHSGADYFANRIPDSRRRPARGRLLSNKKPSGILFKSAKQIARLLQRTYQSMKHANKIAIMMLIALTTLVAVAGCGGGGGGGGNSPGGTSPSGTATVTGTLVDKVSQLPLTNVIVTVSSSPNLSATTSGSGTFSISSVPVGPQTLGFTSNSSSIGSDTITVVSPSTSLGAIDVSTEGSPPPAPPI